MDVYNYRKIENLMLKNQLPLALAIFSTYFLGGCISQSYDEPSEVMSLDSSINTNYHQDQNDSKDRNQIVDFINKFNSEQVEMTPEDEAFLETIPQNPGHLSLEETALGLGIVHKWLAIVNRRGPEIDERELSDGDESLSSNSSTTPQGAEDWPRSLEDLVVEKNFDFTKALSANAYLKSFHFQQLVLAALKSGTGQSDAFVAGVKKALKENAQVWSKLQKELEEGGSYERSDIDGDDAGMELQEEKVAPALPFGGNTFVSDEDLLKDAQALLDQGEHLKAVERLRSMSQESVFYATSLEKIKEISNVAVQDLRRKAARAFQSAKPIADRRTRAAYLSEAKEFLQQAIDLYPTADQIQTVRENLEVIDKSLEVLNNQISQSSP